MEEEMESRRVQETFPHSHRRKQAEKPMSLEAQISLYSFLFSGKWTRWGWGEEARKKRGGHSWGSGEGTGLASCPQLSHTHTHTHDLKSRDSWNVVWPWRRLWLLGSVSFINLGLLSFLLLVEDPDLNLTDICGHLCCVRHGWVDSSNQRVTFYCPTL